MAEIKAGQYVTDGTSVFILDDVRDGNRVGDIVFRPVLHDGYIKANGATVTASEYPRLLKFAQDNNLLVDSDTWNSNKTRYVYDSIADTLKVPDAQERVLQGTTDTIRSIESGLPNIYGTAIMGLLYQDWFNRGTGVISISHADDMMYNNTTYGTTWGAANLTIDSSKYNGIYGASPHVQPPALALIPQIKY